MFFTLYCIFHNLYRMLHSKRVYFHSKGLNLHCQWMKLRRKCVNYSFSIVFWKHYNARKKIPRPPDVTVATFLVGASAGSLTINNYHKSQFVQINLHRPQNNFTWSYTFWIDLKFCAALWNQDRARFLERPATTLSLNLAWLRRSLECASYPFQPKKYWNKSDACINMSILWGHLSVCNHVSVYQSFVEVIKKAANPLWSTSVW